MDFSRECDALIMADIEQQLDTSALELVYEKTSLLTNNTCYQEEIRQYRAQILLLKYENDDVHNRVAQSDNRIKETENRQMETKTRLDETVCQLEKTRQDLRAKARDNEMLTAEISSLQSVTSDSTRLLTEKLSLVRELSCLKPEMEHLKSQAVANRHLLSEKLALQRQLSTIQVELETEKRSIQRALAKEGQQKAEDAKLETQIESLQNDLLQERRQRERAEREAQKAQTDWDNKRATLESRLDAFRNKLRITKEQLKDAQVELKNSHTHTHEPPHHSAAISGRNDFSEVSRKRKTHLGDASTIGTPGISPMLKKGKSAATLPGDKSVFSITPFLNRASSVALETHDEPDGKDHDEDPRASCDPLNDQEGEAQSSSLIAIDSNGGFKEHGKVVRKRKLGSSGAFPTRSHKTIASLEKLNEREEENDNIKLTVPPLITADSSLPLAAISIENPGTKRRKRNLLGQGLDKSIFEGDEEETNNDNRKIGGKPDIAVRKRNFTLLKPDSRITSNSSATGFGAISPLKRKIKTIN